MSVEILDGKGVTKERLEKSAIVSRPRTITAGGVVLTYGQQDTEHCTLDILQNKGFIESEQHDAGYQLRRLFYTFNVTGRWIEEGGKAYDGDTITPKDIAEAEYNKALQSIDKSIRGLIRAICIEDTHHIPADHYLIQLIQNGLTDLYKHFKNNSCNHD